MGSCFYKNIVAGDSSKYEQIWGRTAKPESEMTLPGSPKSSYDATPTKDSFEAGEKIKSGCFACDVCEKTFSKKCHLKSHISTHNVGFNSSEDDDRGKQNICDFCCKRFTAKKNLLKHLRNIHKKFNEAEQMVVKKIKCPEKGCEFICRMMKDLRCHIEESHKIKLLKDTLQFQNDKVFQKWKKEEESNTVSWFVTGRKKTTLMDGSKKQTFYCHRTGQYNPKSDGKYRVRSVGSCKIGMTCPASMEVTEFPDGHLTVIYYKTHLGHVQDVVYLKLSKEERMELAEKIEQGFSFDAILEDVKESRNPKENKKKRIHMLSKKDLYRIMRTENGKKKKTEDINKADVGIQEGDEPLLVENLEIGKNEENFQHCFTVYPANGELQQCIIEDPTKAQTDLNIPQVSGEGIASQIVILSPEMDYASVAKIILLSTGETAPQGALTHIPVEGSFTQKLEQEPQGAREFTLEEKGKPNKSNLSMKIKEKLNRISESLPKSEYLTPKQFNLICTKLDGVLDIFNTANAKAKTRGSAKKKGKSKTESEGVRCETNQGIIAQPIYESSLLYAVYN